MLESVARVVIAMSSASLLVAGVAVLVFEARRSRPEPEARDRGPLALVNYVGILAFVVVGLGSAVTMAGTVSGLPAPLEVAARIVGIVLASIAGLLALWGLRSIGSQMASEAEVRPDTVLVTGGAFALVRHPLYLSILLLWAAGALALLGWVMAIGCLLLVPAFVARARLEERLLVAHFGDAYRDYAARVPMLVPRLP